MPSTPCLRLVFVSALLMFSLNIRADDAFHAGPLYDRSQTILAPGTRLEVVAPFHSWQTNEGVSEWVFAPFASGSKDTLTDTADFDFIYPLLTYDRYGTEYRFQIFQIFNFSGGREQNDDDTRRFALFPFYMQQRSPDPEKNYTSVFPFYGHLEGRLFRTTIDFAAWPLYVKTTRGPTLAPPEKDEFLKPGYGYARRNLSAITTWNYVYPFVHVRRGEGLRGWQVLPFAGQERKEVTQKTNDWGDVDLVEGHDKRFYAWPLWFDQTRGIGSTNLEHSQAFLPFYSYMRSPARDSTSYLWPLGLTITDDRARRYHEVDAPWPLMVFAHGEGKNTTRVFPLFSHAKGESLETRFYLWPIYHYKHLQTEALDRVRWRILYFLYSDITEKNRQTGDAKRRVDFWPLFTWRRDLQGNENLRVFTIVEPVLPNSKSIERNYAPLWSVWRAEKNAKTGASSRSLLWNLYRRDASPGVKNTSLLFGLIQYHSGGAGRPWRLLFIPMGRNRDAASPITVQTAPARTE